MVREAVIHKVIEEIGKAFNGRCATVTQVVKYVKDAELNVSHSLVRFALEAAVAEGRARKYKLSKAYVLYCFGKKPRLTLVVDYRDVEECIKKLVPSATLFQIAECVLGARSRGNLSAVYLTILFALIQMLQKKKIHSFEVLLSARGRLKVVIKK
jgi:hypothetical protein